MRGHLRRIRDDYRLPIQTPSGWVVINLINHLEGSISHPLEAGTSLALMGGEVVNKVGHLILFFFSLFLFLSQGTTGDWGNSREKILHLCSKRSPPFEHSPSLLRGLGGQGRNPFSPKGESQNGRPYCPS